MIELICYELNQTLENNERMGKVTTILTAGIQYYNNNGSKAASIEEDVLTSEVDERVMASRLQWLLDNRKCLPICHMGLPKSNSLFMAFIFPHFSVSLSTATNTAVTDNDTKSCEDVVINGSIIGHVVAHRVGSISDGGCGNLITRKWKSNDVPDHLTKHLYFHFFLSGHRSVASNTYQAIPLAVVGKKSKEAIK